MRHTAHLQDHHLLTNEKEVLSQGIRSKEDYNVKDIIIEEDEAKETIVKYKRITSLTIVVHDNQLIG